MSTSFQKAISGQGWNRTDSRRRQPAKKRQAMSRAPAVSQPDADGTAVMLGAAPSSDTRPRSFEDGISNSFAGYSSDDGEFHGDVFLDGGMLNLGTFPSKRKLRCRSLCKACSILGTVQSSLSKCVKDLK